MRSEEADDRLGEAVVPWTAGPFLKSQFAAFLKVSLIDSLALEGSLLVVDVSVDLIVYVETSAVDIRGADA